METTFAADTPCSTDLEEEITVVSGESKNPASVLTDKYCQEIAHPHMYPSDKYDYKVQKDTSVSTGKYFHQRLLNYSQIFAANINYISFAHSVMQKIQLIRQISIAMRMVTSNNLTLGVLNKSLKSTVRPFIAQEKGYSYINSIKKTPARWKKNCI